MVLDGFKTTTGLTVMPEGEIFFGGPVVIGGDNLPSPSSNRVN